MHHRGALINTQKGRRVSAVLDVKSPPRLESRVVVRLMTIQVGSGKCNGTHSDGKGGTELCGCPRYRTSNLIPGLCHCGHVFDTHS